MNTPQQQIPTLFNLSTQTEYPLGVSTIVGRHEDCNLVLKCERGASRKHARITNENNNVVLMDLGSLNGTMVNGREISRPVQLTHGDIVIFDEQEYQFNDPNSPSQSNSDNVTVIANKDEIGQPDKIKPAIRVIESEQALPAIDANGTHDFDNTQAWNIPHTDLAPMDALDEQVPNSHYSEPCQVERRQIDQRETFTAIPATSRPGGDAPKIKRRNEQVYSHSYELKPKPIWLRWFVVIPLIILLSLIAFYFVYTAGFAAAILSNVKDPL